jgi:hypothetical protein
MIRSYLSLDSLAAIARAVRQRNLKDDSEGIAALAMAQGRRPGADNAGTFEIVRDHSRGLCYSHWGPAVAITL